MSPSRARLAPSKARPGARPLALFALFALGSALPACGRPATREECEEIFRKSAELELRSRDVTDPDAIAKRTEEVRAAKGDALIEQCVGRRITESALACVRSAGTPSALDACLE